MGFSVQNEGASSARNGLGELSECHAGASAAERTTRDPRAGRNLKIMLVGRLARYASAHATAMASALGECVIAGMVPQPQKQTVAQSGPREKT